ncbi:membrane hypothetical protein [Halomonas sp. A3H3]|uniref:hypothetical protein n=1 Tax=unclassified Halomonas TaxID=2609666 RepID=UPI00038D7185|nr:MULTISPECIES: hypothetical protein [unclassified Halomonas]CDG54553.1 membrane hypothetical protein [Halomonas sp. A3H3]
MASSRFLLLILILIAGYIFISNYTLTKGRIARSNGQHLYLKSAVCGLIFFIISYFLQNKLSDYFLFNYTLNFVPNAFKEDIDQLTRAALLAISLSVFFLTLLQLPVYWSRFILNSTWLDRQLEKRFSNKFANFLIKVAEALWLTLQYTGWKYAQWVERASLAGNPVDELLLDVMLDEDGAIMTCDDNGKVFIGFILELPDPTQPHGERTITMVPIMSGSLCKDFQQLHITTDYSDTLLPTIESEADVGTYDSPSDIAILIYTKKIRILRRFDLGMFEAFFRRKVCACGHDIYLPKPVRQNIMLATSSKDG